MLLNSPELEKHLLSCLTFLVTPELNPHLCLVDSSPFCRYLRWGGGLDPGLALCLGLSLGIDLALVLCLNLNPGLGLSLGLDLGLGLGRDGGWSLCPLETDVWDLKQHHKSSSLTAHDLVAMVIMSVAEQWHQSHLN